jgi:hypothetical protein
MPRNPDITKKQLIKIISAYKKKAMTCTPHTRSNGKKLTKAQIESKWMKNPVVKKKVDEVKVSKKKKQTNKPTTRTKPQKQATITSFFVRR